MRAAELAALHCVAPGDVEGRELLAHGLPGNGEPRHLQDLVGVPEAVGVGQLEEVRHHDILERDVGVLDGAQGDLVFDLRGAVALGRGVNQEALDLVVGEVAGVDDHPVGERGVADPALGAIEDPAVALAARRGAGAAGNVGAAQRLGEAEGTDLPKRVDVRQPGILLLLRGEGLDGPGEQTVVDAHERGDGRVRAGDLGVQDAGEKVGVALAPHGADEVDLRQLRDQVHRELAAVPAVHRDRLDLARQELPDFGQPVPLLAAEQLLEGEEVAVGVRQVVDVDCSFGHGVPSRVISSDQRSRASSQKVSYSRVTYRRAGSRASGAGQRKRSRGRCLNIGPGSAQAPAGVCRIPIGGRSWT